MAIYVMSDIHGQKKLFDNMLKKIKFTSDDELYILGDVVDRGPEPIKLLLKVMSTRNIHLIMGNHEYMMKTFYKYNSNRQAYSNQDCNDILFLWKRNGGNVTMEQFNNCVPTKKTKILEFLDTLPVEEKITVNEKEFILCHAQPHPTSFKNDPFENYNIGCLYSSDIEFSVWQRYIPGTKLGDTNRKIGVIPDENFKNKTVIFGHTPVYCYYDDIVEENKILYEDNTINIDCGCAAIPFDNNENKGRLACIRLDDMKEFYEEP